MKKGIKKLTAIMLVMLMAIGTMLPAFADNDELGTITITNAMPEQEYSIYRILDLESYNKIEDAYIYKMNNEWKAFFDQDEISGNNGYVEIDNEDHVKWRKKEGDNNIGVEDFVNAAIQYAKKNEIVPTEKDKASRVTGNEETVELKFDGLILGYYLVDSNVGTLCSLNTTNPSVNITDKNEQPTIEKKVKEGNSWEDKNSAQIGDTVNFKVTITAGKGAQKYILHDIMEDGLTFNGNVTVTKNNFAVENDNNANYVLLTSNQKKHNNCTFELVFTDDFCNGLNLGDEIVVTYDAILNENANVEKGENNTVYLSYGEDSSIDTLPDDTDTYTYQFQIIKTNSIESDGKYNLLTGALFSLYTQQSGGNAISFIDEGNGIYRVATDNEINDVDTVKLTQIPAGIPILKGLDDNKSYWLEEVKAPDGYNPMSGRKEVILTGNNLAGENAIDILDNQFNSDIKGGVQIQNSKGSLPTTGGMGTMILYVAGGILVAGAGICLVVMKRRKNEEV